MLHHLNSQCDHHCLSRFILPVPYEKTTRYSDLWANYIGRLSAANNTVFRKAKLNNHQNNERYEKYCSALKYAIEFEHNALQNMTFEGFENNGIKYPEKNVETTLLCELQSANSWSEERSKYGYNIQKAEYLNYDSGWMNKQWAYQMINEAMPFFKKYVAFENANGDFEYYSLVQIALYFDCLDNKCSLNKNIPNDLRFRDKQLAEDEIQKLLTEEPINENADVNLMEFLEKIFNEQDAD